MTSQPEPVDFNRATQILRMLEAWRVLHPNIDKPQPTQDVRPERIPEEET